MFDSKTKRAIKKLYLLNAHPIRGKRIAPVHYAITERGYWKEAFLYYAEDGHVVVCRSGMDCDCTQYASARRVPVPTSIFAWVRGEEQHREYLDGTESMWLERPTEDNHDSHRLADRALEAYEDGHPGTVYWGAL